jgi:hypothetical protein
MREQRSASLHEHGQRSRIACSHAHAAGRAECPTASA